LKRREEMERTKLELAIQLMHELNNNIFGIMTCLELLKDVVPENHEERNCLDLACAASKRLAELSKKLWEVLKSDGERRR